MDTETLTALAEPNRLKIIELLREQPRSVNEITELLKFHQPQASKHLRRLSDAGLVSMKPVAQQRFYTLNADPFLKLDAWINSFQSVWDQRFDNLEKYLKKG